MEVLELLNRYKDIISSIEIIEFYEEEQISKLKIKISLFNSSILWVREVRVKGILVAYSYYWLTSSGRIIIGWDNAPHHKEISTFPHHKHKGKKVEPSNEKNLKDILEFIRLSFFS